MPQQMEHMQRRKRLDIKRLSSLACYVFLVALVASFSSGAYNWALKVHRAQSNAINPVMYPSFRVVNVSGVCCNTEPHYKLWRLHDYLADGHTQKRPMGSYTRVPVVYVHGNGGSTFCARSFSRFLLEANVRQRKRANRDYTRNTKRRLHAMMKQAKRVEWEGGSNATASVEDRGHPRKRFPTWMVDSAEDAVVLEETPLLATELFSVDYLEESYTHSGLITLKEARFLNHSLHALMKAFTNTFSAVVEAPEEPLRRSGAYDSEAIHPLPLIETEYTASVCNPSDGHAVCARAKQHLMRYSTLERVRREVARVQQRGFWLWAESLGGTVAIVAAILSPQLCAGIVMVASPVHYPPLFFDVGSVWLFRAVHAAASSHYPLTAPDSTYDWDRDVFAGTHNNPLTLLHRLGHLPTEELAARLSSVALLSINGGALDDVIPSISASVLRSTPRLSPDAAAVKQHRASLLASPRCAYRRDLSTEALRDCGLPMDHRGLVYGLQFLKASANSVVRAALLPDSQEHFSREPGLPGLYSQRLFPSVVESLGVSVGRSAALLEEFRAVSAMIENADGHVEVMDDGPPPAVPPSFAEVCVGTETPLDLATLPTHLERLTSTGLYDGTDPLHVFIGSTTYRPDVVFQPQLRFFHDEAGTRPFGTGDDSDSIVADAATKLHLPSTLKGPKAAPGKALLTAFSFQVTVAPEQSSAGLVWPQFCFLVKDYDETGDDEWVGDSDQRSFLQYDKIDFAAFACMRQEVYLGTRYIGNRLRVEAHDGYSLVTGVSAVTMETNLLVTTHPLAAVYPMTICGSAHAFYLALRGTDALALDEPEDQIQLFFGPFVTGQYQFSYSWKAFSTYPAHDNSTFICYAFGDNTVEGGARPALELNRLSSVAAAPFLSRGRLEWLIYEWPERWLASFSVYTAIGKLGGCYVLCFFTLLVPVGGLLERYFYRNPQLRPAVQVDRVVAWMRALPPLVALLVMGPLAEVATGVWAEYALQVCRNADPAGSTDRAMTARMGLVEKATLILLYWMHPSYEECQYPWIRIQSVPIWPLLSEHIFNLYMGYCVGVVLTLFVLLLVPLIVMPLGLPVYKGFVRWVILRSRAAGAVVMALLWLTPSVVCRWGLSGVPLCYQTVLSALMAQGVVWAMPWTVRPGLSYQWICSVAVAACWFPSHFEGLVLTIRNHAILHKTPEAMWDSSRYLLTTQEITVHAAVQATLAIVYVTAYLVVWNERSFVHVGSQKKQEGGEESMDKTTEVAHGRATDASVESAEAAGYLLGDLGRAYPRAHRFLLSINHATLWLSIWATLVAMRRPLEGGVTLVGNVILLIYVATFLVSRW